MIADLANLCRAYGLVEQPGHARPTWQRDGLAVRYQQSPRGDYQVFGALLLRGRAIRCRTLAEVNRLLDTYPQWVDPLTE